MPNLLRILKMMGAFHFKNFVFEEEYVNIPIVAIDNDEIFTSIIAQGVNVDNYGILEYPFAHEEEHALNHVKKPKQPQ